MEHEKWRVTFRGLNTARSPLTGTSGAMNRLVIYPSYKTTPNVQITPNVMNILVFVLSQIGSSPSPLDG